MNKMAAGLLNENRMSILLNDDIYMIFIAYYCMGF